MLVFELTFILAIVNVISLILRPQQTPVLSSQHV